MKPRLENHKQISQEATLKLSKNWHFHENECSDQYTKGHGQ